MNGSGHGWRNAENGNGTANGNGKNFWNNRATNVTSADTDSGVALPNDDNAETQHVTNADNNSRPRGAVIATGASTSLSFAGSTGWRYISLSDDEHINGHSGNQDESVGLLHGIRFRGRKSNSKGKKVVMFASGTMPGGEDADNANDDDDADGKKKKKGGVKGKNGGKCREGWLETLMVHGFGSIAHLYVPCVDFTIIDENDVLGNKEEVVVMSRQHAQAHIVIFDDGLEGIALRDL